MQSVCEEFATEGRTSKQSCGKFSLQESRLGAYPSQPSPEGSEVWQLGEDKKGERHGFIEEEESRQTPNEG